MWMMTSEMGFTVTQESGEVQCWRDIVEDRPVVRFLAPAITDYIRKAQDKSIGGEGSHGLLPELETLDREWNQDGRQSSNDRGRKRCLTGVSFTPYEVCNTTRYIRAIDTLLCATTHYGVCESGALHDTGELPGALHDTGKLPRALHDTGELPVALHDMGELTCSSRYGGGTNHPFQQDLSITANTLSVRQALSAGHPTSAIRFLTVLTLRIRVRASKIRG